MGKFWNVLLPRRGSVSAPGILDSRLRGNDNVQLAVSAQGRSMLRPRARATCPYEFQYRRNLRKQVLTQFVGTTLAVRPDSNVVATYLGQP
jgi:hypothetical protein